MYCNLRPAALLTALCLALTGCAVQQPDLERMTAEASPSGWQRQSLPAGSVETWSDFWNRWNDPKLTDLIGKALANNPDIETAAANLRAARATIISANSALWPSATAGADGSRRRSNGSWSNSVSAEASGSLTLNLAGSEFWKADAAYLNAESKAYTLEDVRAATAAETAEAYVNLRSAEAQLEIVKASLKNYMETADTSKWQFEAGTGAASEAEDALVQVASARARIPSLEASILQYRSALMRLTGLPVEKLGLEPTGVIPEPPVGMAMSFPAETIANRPDIRSARRAVESAVETLRSAKTDFFPTLSLTGNIGTTATAVSALGTAGTGVAGLAAALSVPILNWGSLVAAEETAAAQLDSAVATYRSTLLAALEETDNALSTIESTERRVEDLARAVDHAREAEKLSRHEYSAGIGDYSMLLSTQQSLLSAEESELTNRADRAIGYISLYRALGGAWGVEAAKEAREQQQAAAQ
ncbi:efflux transporter outer membrane subunit [Sutterella sp.]|uniref:efflux transporter outer membrane subunit n=1 Tax=Sutterella sp. TaxID=1981025 RepID=UPI0026DEFF35|nr:efflux transporter outer membrane subunit [Sutterella sp.]MDO5530681.1 efflux transporter outer membrane subunit [Sutterella sp.]